MADITGKSDEYNPIKDELRKVVNLQDTEKYTALHYATQQWPQDTVRIILELGANIGIKNIYDEVSELTINL